jgi:hypothetical protein
MILNITNYHGQSLITQNSTYSPELINVFRQFFTAMETRNTRLHLLLEKLSREGVTPENNRLVAEITNHQQETELEIEIVKKLLP